MILFHKNPDTLIKISDWDWLNSGSGLDAIKQAIIEHGPLEWLINNNSHSISVTGFINLSTDNTTIWIIKNSLGTDWGENGFGYITDQEANGFSRRHYIGLPIIEQIPQPHQVQCLDEDGDGYYWWGLGPKPDSCPQCPEETDCDDSNPALGPYGQDFSCECIYQYNDQPLVITSDTIWDQPVFIDRDIILDSCALTVTSKAHFVENAVLIVKPGSRLIINGGTLTKACDGFWKGVEVWGDTSKYQIPYENQGYMEIENGKIECAEIGVLLGMRDQDSLFEKGGGVLKATNSNFLNNTVDVEFYPYHDYLLGQDKGQQCYFRNCNFVMNDSLINLWPVNAHVILRETDDLKFEGCTFEYVEPYQDFGDHGTGILSYNSSFWLQSRCIDPWVQPCQDKDSCEFINLDYGVRAFNDGQYRHVKIEDTWFYLNEKAVYLSGYTGTDFEYNTLYCFTKAPPPFSKNESYNETIYGLYLDGCTGYTIENNEFYEFSLPFNGYTNTIRSVGIYVRNSGPDANQIYDNVFHNLNLGIAAVGENRGEETGLCIKCNEFYLNIHDVFVHPDTLGEGGKIIGIAEYQGDPNDTTTYGENLAGNTFTIYPMEFSYNYFNDLECEHINYVHHYQSTDPEDPWVRPKYVNDTNHISRIEMYQNFHEENSCPAHSDGYDEMKILFDESENEIALVDQDLLLYTDGGDTDGMNSDVLLSDPEEAMQVRQQLLDESPYLSDTVMHSAISKEDVLPNAMVRDVLTANPQSAKNDKLMDALDDRSTPMPPYMMGQIMQGTSVLGAKEIFEAKKNSNMLNYNRAMYSVMGLYRSDTNLLYPNDSIEYFLLSSETAEANYRLAFEYLRQKRTAAAIDLLNDIPVDFELSEQEAGIHQDYNNFFIVLHQLYTAGSDIYELDSSKIASLEEIWANDRSLANVYARNTLIAAGLVDYTEIIHFPSLFKSVYTEYPPAPDEGEPVDARLELYPNPAEQYFIASYRLAEFLEVPYLLISKANGQHVKMIRLTHTVDQLVVSTAELPAGMYVISVIQGKKIAANERIIIK
ncbi:MAG: T9SS type A sorting domain-containing protein [Bacteroidales bacterium]|nr:T9SS type A sorting domain-containing protein [Bacteroidales bacterium]